MKKISLIVMAVVFGLFCSTLTWAGNGAGLQDGSMLDIDLADTIIITGVVVESAGAGTGLVIDEGDGDFTTVYGLGPLSYWESLDVAKPSIDEKVNIETIEVTFSDGSTRLIAVSLTIGNETITLRDAEEGGRPLWRGFNKQGGAGDNARNGEGTGNGACPNYSEDCSSAGTCTGKGGGNGGNCPLTAE